MGGRIDRSGLRELYKDNPVARAFLDHASERKRDRSETSVDSTLINLKKLGLKVSRAEIVKLFKTLEKLNCGKFMEGRRGKLSRFVWEVSIVSVGNIAIGKLESDKPSTEEAVRFQIRRNNPHESYRIDVGSSSPMVIQSLAQ